MITSTVTVNSTNKAAENKTVENQKTISQIAGDLSNINHQAESVNKGDVPNPENKSESKTSKNDKLRNALISGALIIGLLIPFPQTVGGEIEIEGSPGVQQAVLRASVNGIVEKVLVQTNQQVKAGQQIVALRNWDLDEKRLEAENHLAKLKGSIASQQAQSQVAKAEYLRAVQEYKRQKAESDYVEKNAKALKTDNLPPRIEATKKEVEQLTLQAKSLKQKAKLHQYLSQKGVYPSQGALQSACEAVSAAKQAQSLNAQLKAEVSELEEKSIESQPKAEQVFIASQANLERLKVTQQEINSTAQEVKGIENLIAQYKEEERLSLKSPIDGVVLTLKTDLLLGQHFNKGDIIAVVGDLSQVRIKLQLPEESIAYVEPKQEVTVRVKGVPDRVFNGEVQSIAPITSETNEQINKKRIFDNTIFMNNPELLLKPGMTGYAIIHTQKKKSLLGLAWDEVYRVFRLDRYISRNPFADLISSSSRVKSEDI